MERGETREKTPSKRILESIHNKLGRTTTCDKSPMWENHKFSTPKNKVRMAKNPFEPLLHEVMHTNIMSPSVFAALPSKAPIDNDKFCWTIEELASFHPVDLEKSPLVQSEATDHVLEAVTQAKINKFFSAKTILPSPAGPATDVTPLIASSASPLATPPTAFLTDASSTGTIHMGPSQKRRKLCATIGCQTNLSLPVVLPKALERLLRPYMKHDALGQLMGLLCPDGYRISEGLQHSPMKDNLNPLLEDSPSKKPLQESPFSDGYTTNTNNWECSPISQDVDSGESGNSVDGCSSRASVTKLDFSAGHMSVDMSQQLCWSKNSLHLDNTPKKPTYSESSPSPDNDKQLQAQSIGNDSSFSRMEDDYMSFHRSRNASFEAAGGSGNVPNFDMDISFSNTPKSRSASASRRRLCDSFASFGDDEEEESDENIKQLKVEENDGKESDGCDDTLESGSLEEYKPIDLVRKQGETSSLTDAGYNTASTFEESSLYFERNTILFASTPTKAKIPFWPINE